MPETLRKNDDPAMTAASDWVRSGLAPEVVAHQAASALGTQQFWLFTHPELEQRMDNRNAEMKAALHRS